MKKRLNRDSLIESRMGCQGGSGVRLAPLQESLRQIMKSRQPMDDYPKVAAGAKGFVVRRWLPR